MKVTGGQRIEIPGREKEDLPGCGPISIPPAWFPATPRQIHPHREDLRRRGTLSFWHSAVHGNGGQAGKMLFDMYTPTRSNWPSPAAPRNCAEAGIRTSASSASSFRGTDLHRRQRRHQDRGGAVPRKVKTDQEVLEYSGAFLQLYREEGLTLIAPATTSSGSDWIMSKQDCRRRREPQGLYNRLLDSLKDARIPGQTSRASPSSSSRIRNDWKHEGGAMSNWKPVCSLEDIPRLGSRVVRHEEDGGDRHRHLPHCQGESSP